MRTGIIYLLLNILNLLMMSHIVGGQPVDCKYVPVDDREFRINGGEDISTKRREIIRAIWGHDQLPVRSDVMVSNNVASPLSPNGFVARVDKIEIYAERIDTIVDLSYLFVPVERNNRLVLFCPGHTCSLKDADRRPTHGIEAAITGLLSAGFDVFAFFMPHVSETHCDLNHCRIINTDLGYTDPPHTYGLRMFLEPAITGLNYLLKMNTYEDIHMVGLSGGGWTTNILAAIDDRIRLSFCVAGSMPLFYRYGGSIGDIEQYLPALYKDIAGYPDLYILNSYGEGRKLTHIFNRYDDCCFGEKQHNPDRYYFSDLLTFAFNMKEKLATLGCENQYRLVIDDSAPNHQISAYTLESIILPAMRSR